VPRDHPGEEDKNSCCTWEKVRCIIQSHQGNVAQVIKGEMRMNKARTIAEAWNFYAKTNSLRPGTKKYQEAQHAFILGARSLTGDEGLPAIISVYVMSGRDIAEIPAVMDQREAVANENDSQVA
jgi:hypothetical protein